MHDLERRALDDPFLADALEGYQQAGSDQQKNLAELSSRLQNRMDKKVRVMVPGIQLSVAASILVMIGIGVWLVLKNNSQKQPQVAENVVKTEKQQQPSISAPSSPMPRNADTAGKRNTGTLASISPRSLPAASDQKGMTPPPVSSLVTKQDSGNNANVPVQQTTPPASAGHVTVEDKNKSLQYKSNTQSANDAIMQGLSDKKFAAKKAPQTPPETLLEVPRADVNIKPSRGGNNTLVGYVTGNNQPIVGAIVKLAGRDFGVVTDENGRFVMHDVPDNKSLVVRSLGYATKQVKVNGSDSVNVSLDPSANTLMGVTIINPPVNANNSSVSTDAHPSQGWKALNDYLDKNAISPDGQTGQVKLSFMVDGRGVLSGFKITQSLSPAADQKAIDLITNGPAWAGNIDGQAHEVKLMVTFH